MKLVRESLSEAMIMQRDRSDDEREKFIGSYIPPEYKEKFDQMMTTRQKKQRAAQASFKQAHLGTFRTIKELENTSPQDNDWILRSADGQGDLLLFNGDMINKEEANELKSYYKIAQDLHYFDARPILYKHWKNLPDKLKLASRRQNKKY